MTVALVMLAVGSMFCWLAVSGWKHRKEERISLIEAVILKTTGAEPLPLGRFDRWFQLFQLVMISALGPIIGTLGAMLLLHELDLI